MTLQSRLARLERRPKAVAPIAWSSKPVDWLAFAELITGMAKAGYLDLEAGHWQLWPYEAMDAAEFAEGVPSFVTAGKLAKDGRIWLATAPADDPAFPLYRWLAGAMNRES